MYIFLIWLIVFFITLIPFYAAGVESRREERDREQTDP